MDAARWRQSEHHARQRVHRLINGIVLILLVTVAVGLLVCATLALVGLDCPNAYPHIVGRKASGYRGHIQSDAVRAEIARAHVTVCLTIKTRRGTVLS
jgi:hypothetical protein